jgi:ubiquinol-cytochrome c reductase cytochrome b subunit
MLGRWATRKTMRAADERLGSGKFLRNQLNKVFPDHWSFMLGELALYSFIVLLVTGTLLSFYYHASEHDIVYHGSYQPLDGVKASEAYISTVDITFEIRAGLLLRQIHHWAALLFVASIVVHMCRIYFTGAFRKPREINWVIGTTLLILAMAEGFAGYSLPDDLLSGTGLRIAYSIIESIPVIGSYVATFLFNGQFPGDEGFIPRLYVIHVLFLPAMILALITVHLMIVWHQKHTQFPEPGHTERNVVGSRLWPGYSFKAQGLAFMVFGVLATMGALFQINPIWLYGPYDPAQASSGSQPDWYMTWLEGSLRLMTGAETHFLGHTVSWDVFLPAVVLPIGAFLVFYAYPFVERWVTHDHASHELVQSPREVPTRTALGVAMISFYIILLVAGSNDVVANAFRLNLTRFTWFLRGAVVFVPIMVFFVTRRVCRRLQRLAAEAAVAEVVPREVVATQEVAAPETARPQ